MCLWLWCALPCVAVGGVVASVVDVVVMVAAGVVDVVAGAAMVAVW